MSDTPRRRRSAPPPSPTTMIVNFFLDSPLASAQDALEWAQALVARRTLNETAIKVPPDPAPLKKFKLPPFTPGPVTPPSPAQTALAQEAIPAPIAPPSPTLRQRAKRSDAGQPRGKRAAEAADVAEPPKRGRGRPPISTPVAVAPPASQPAAPLPELPPQDVPYDARVDEPVEVG